MMTRYHGWLVPLLLLGSLATYSPAQRLLFDFDGRADGDLFGISVDGAGDVNADGYPDIIVGASPGGYALVISGKDGSKLHLFTQQPGGGTFGIRVSGAGDTNQDGHADVLVGDSGFSSNGFSGNGRVYLFSGKDANSLQTVAGTLSNVGLAAVGQAGDVNLDGYDDVIVGGIAVVPGNIGYAQVLSGKNGIELHAFFGDAANDFFGNSVGGAGDVNQDSYPDLVVGAKQIGQAGYARVFSGKDGAVLATFSKGQAGDNLGHCVDAGGDVDSDGFPDVLVGAPNASPNGLFAAGSSYVVSGLWLATGLTKDVLHSLHGNRAFELSGTSVAGVGDMNLDGYGDILVGAPNAAINAVSAVTGMARVYSGQNGSLWLSQIGNQTSAALGKSVAAVGDVDRDGFADAVAGAFMDGSAGLNRGRTKIFSRQARTLDADTLTLSLAAANSQKLSLDAGPMHTGKLYWIFGNEQISGQSPGVSLGKVHLPLNPDIWTEATIAQANCPSLLATRGILAAGGKANASLNSLGPLPSALLGLALQHAFVVYDSQPGGDSYFLSSNLLPLTMVP